MIRTRAAGAAGDGADDGARAAGADARSMGPGPPPGELTVRRLLAQSSWQGAHLLAGAAGLDRVVRFLNVMTVPDIVRWTKPDELLITTSYPLPRQAAQLCDLIERLGARGVSALAVKLNEYLPQLPRRVVTLADQIGLPLISIPEDTPIDDLLAESFSLLVTRGTVARADSHEIHENLLKVVLSGGGLGALVHELSGLLGGAVVAVVDAGGKVRATAGAMAGLPGEWCTGWGDGPPVVGARGVAALAQVRAGNIDHGWVLVADTGRQLPEIAGVAIEHGAVIAALEMTRDLAVLTVERQFAYEALRDLLTAPVSDCVENAERAVRFGWELDRTVAVLVADLRGGRPVRQPGKSAGRPPPAGTRTELSPGRALDVWLGTVRDADARAAVAGSSLELVAVVDAAIGPEQLARKASDEIVARCGWRLLVGVSKPCLGTAELPRGYQEARTALRVAIQLASDDPASSYAALGLYRLFSELERHEIELFVHETFGPLLDLPPTTRDELMTTLEVILEERVNLAEAARRLHYHYNTMRYRIAKLEQLVGNFTGDPGTRVALEVAVHAARFLKASRTTGEAHRS